MGCGALLYGGEDGYQPTLRSTRKRLRRALRAVAHRAALSPSGRSRAAAARGRALRPVVCGLWGEVRQRVIYDTLTLKTSLAQRATDAARPRRSPLSFSALSRTVEAEEELPAASEA